MHSGHLNGRLVAEAACLTQAGPLIVGWRGRAGRYALPDHGRRSIASPAGHQGLIGAEAHVILIEVRPDIAAVSEDVTDGPA
jgi:hypothetical protein